MQLIEQFLRATVELLPVNHTQAARFAAEKNVFGDRQFLDERKLLIDDRDARLSRHRACW